MPKTRPLLLNRNLCLQIPKVSILQLDKILTLSLPKVRPWKLTKTLYCSIPRVSPWKLSNRLTGVNQWGSNPKESLNATNFTPKSEPARPMTRQHCGQSKNCLTYGDSVLNCRGPPAQSPNHKTQPWCHRCQNCLTYGDNVRNCKGLPSRNLKPTSSGPANNNAIPKGTTTASPTPLTPTFLEHQVKTTLSNNEPAYTNHDRAINTFAKRDRRVTLSDDLSVIPNETPSVHTSGPPEVSPNNSHPTLDKTNTSELTPNSQPARPKTQQNCGHCQNCHRYGDTVRDCKGLPTQNLKPASTRPPTPHTPSKTSSSSLSSSNLQNNLKQKQNTSECPSRT